MEIESSNLVNQSKNLEDGWYRDSSFYHVWVKSFADSTTGPLAGDGCGDLKGITEKLDYIKNEVGCDAIWLSPIFDCASKGTAASYNMHGYDTIDYYAINPRFGTKKDLGNLLAAADRGMKSFDFVPNHISDQYPWFAQSARANGKDDWYLWAPRTDSGIRWEDVPPGTATPRVIPITTAPFGPACPILIFATAKSARN